MPRRRRISWNPPTNGGDFSRKPGARSCSSSSPLAGVVGAMSGGAITLSMKVAAPGLMVMAIVYFMGAVGGAHLNPAVTLAFAVRRNFPWNRVPGYIVAQFVAALPQLVSSLRCSAPSGCSAPPYRPGISDFKALIMEVL